MQAWNAHVWKLLRYGSKAFAHKKRGKRHKVSLSMAELRRGIENKISGI